MSSWVNWAKKKNASNKSAISGLCVLIIHIMNSI